MKRYVILTLCVVMVLAAATASAQEFDLGGAIMNGIRTAMDLVVELFGRLLDEIGRVFVNVLRQLGWVSDTR